MGETGDGKFDTKLLTKKKVIRTPKYESYIEKALMDLDLNCKWNPWSEQAGV